MTLKKEENKENLKIAGRQYHTEDYKGQDTLSTGLAITHEQVSDAYTEGEIKPVIDNVNGEDIEIPRKGYE
jgi:hypothetical protein